MINFPKNSVITANRAYLDFEPLKRYDRYFVVRFKDDIKYIDTKENPLPEDSGQHILLKDEQIELTNKQSREKYPNEHRSIAVYDKQNNQTIILIGDNLSWTASTIAKLYKQNWRVEISFSKP